LLREKRGLHGEERKICGIKQLHLKGGGGKFINHNSVDPRLGKGDGGKKGYRTEKGMVR